jgi:SIR2-like protein
VSLPPGLQLLQELIVDHRKDRGGDHLLVPCLHEELEKDIDLLRAGVQRCGGTLFALNCSEDEWEFPKGPISRDRTALVEGILKSAVDALPAEVVIEITGQGIRARLHGHDGPVEPSLTPILRAAAVIAGSAFDEFELILMAVSVAPTDPRRRELLWNLLTINPVDLNIAGEPSTLVPIIGASLDADTDYLRKPAIRYVTRWDRVIRRSSLSQAHAVKSIANNNNRPLVLFLGAGASASSGIPLGNAYRDLALEELIGHREDGRTGAEAFFDLLHERQHFLHGETQSRASFSAELTLERVLLESFRDLGFRPRAEASVIQEIAKDCAAALDYVRPGRKAIRELAAKLPGQLIIMTVNFDQLIEKDLGVNCSVFYRPEHYRERLDELVSYVRGDSSIPLPILKLHGSIEDPDSLIATIDTTSAGLHDDVLNALNQVLEAAGKPLRWVWIGCSMRDRDMNLWLGGLSANALDEWWVDPLPGKSLDDFFALQRAPKWSARGQELRDRLIIDSADGFLRSLANQVATR